MHAPDHYMEILRGLPPERQTYAAMVAAVDDGIGRIRASLEKSGQWDNSIFFFTGGNGATTEKRAGLGGQYATAGDNGPDRGFKFSAFDGGLHIPGFVHFPSRIRPRVLPQIAQAMDILPTLLDAVGLPIPAELDGLSIWRVLIDDAPSPHRELYWTDLGQLAIRLHQRKLVANGKDFDRRPDGNKALTGPDALFLSNHSEDPGETRNLRSQYPALADELATLAAKWQALLPLH